MKRWSGLSVLIATLLVFYALERWSAFRDYDVGILYHPESGRIYTFQLHTTVHSYWGKAVYLVPFRTPTRSMIDAVEYRGTLSEYLAEQAEFDSILATGNPDGLLEPLQMRLRQEVQARIEAPPCWAAYPDDVIPLHLCPSMGHGCPKPGATRAKRLVATSGFGQSSRVAGGHGSRCCRGRTTSVDGCETRIADGRTCVSHAAKLPSSDGIECPPTGERTGVVVLTRHRAGPEQWRVATET